MTRKKAKTVLLTLIILLSLALLAAVAYTAAEDRKYAADETVARTVRDQVVLTDAEPVAGRVTKAKKREPAEEDEAVPVIPDDENLLRVIDFESLQSINPDAQRWIYIPDTNIDYYVMQEPNAGEFYYLWRDIYRQPNSWGSIFAPKQEDNDAHRLIFGHHMATHEYAFATITDFASRDFAAEHPYVYLYYPDHAERWAVWCAEHVYSDDMVYLAPYIAGTTEYQDLLDHLAQRAEVVLTDAPSNQDDLLVLSTCHRAWGGARGRFLVLCTLDTTFTP